MSYKFDVLDDDLFPSFPGYLCEYVIQCILHSSDTMSVMHTIHTHARAHTHKHVINVGLVHVSYLSCAEVST
jgi:hypothetical protein